MSTITYKTDLRPARKVLFGHRLLLPHWEGRQFFEAPAVVYRVDPCRSGNVILWCLDESRPGGFGILRNAAEAVKVIV